MGLPVLTPVRDFPFFPVVNAVFPKGLPVAPEPVRNTACGVNISHIPDPFVPSPDQIVGQQVGSVISVGNNGVKRDGRHVGVQKKHRQHGLADDGVDICFPKLSHKDQSVYLSVLQHLRSIVFLLVLFFQQLQDAVVMVVVQRPDHLFIKLPVK